uniref:Polysaccharide biosynthesis protein C-terminal domain-containing protein n=1 Tax=Chromera velia CCMP2878 TaxID=1169474 RepID=A0A0G4HNZ0_9ALVE|eukprot:Cvel_7688.t1-p1 / transcript=Cvel_7688.t1 / gene=Cvel_7688 / organism=Chromera_velia_CCMP2878 / gene_product=MATE efflux family protein 2, chloroplastic, putative / transcript_product=MATE efflux family protein 2, chloroplastic, putative / location=Cvel_scaffold408:24962-26737(+) / protein_length=592 / sequence_SO=supercontig / SO=protein_coding / is_pseudo=false
MAALVSHSFAAFTSLPKVPPSLSATTSFLRPASHGVALQSPPVLPSDRSPTDPSESSLPPGHCTQIVQRHRHGRTSLPSALSASREPTETSEKETEKGTGEAILSLAVPALASLAIDPLMTIADTAFVGRASDSADALAGMGSSAALLTFAFYIFNFLTTATTPLVASRRAAGEENGALTVGGQALGLAIALGLVLCAFLSVFSDLLLRFMGTGITGPQAGAYAASFLSVRALAAPAVLFCSAATGVLRGFLDTKTPIVVLGGANAVNLLLDILLIPGAGMGPRGAAIATTTAEWVAAFWFGGVLAGKLPSAEGDLGQNRKGHAGPRGSDADPDRASLSSLDSSDPPLVVVPSFSIPPWAEVKALVVASSSVFLRTLVLQAAISSAAALAARSHGFGPEGPAASVAAHQIALQLWLLCSFVCDALAAASQALVADALGKCDDRRVKKITQTVLGYSLALGSVLATGLAVGTFGSDALSIERFFTADPSTQTALKPLLTLLIIAQPLNAVVFAADGVLQGAAEFPYQAKSMLLSVLVAGTVFVGLESPWLGVGEGDSNTLVHVWDALLVLQLMRGLTSMKKIVDSRGPIRLAT